MLVVKTKYTGGLSTSTEYPMSAHSILTSAKPFGPTDLFAASLGSCIITYVDFIARKNNFETPGIEIEIKKTLNADASKVTAFDVILNLQNNFTSQQKQIIEAAAQSCPVGNSIHPDIRRTYVFNY